MSSLTYKLFTFQDEDQSSDNETVTASALNAESGGGGSVAIAANIVTPSTVAVKPTPNADKPLLR